MIEILTLLIIKHFVVDALLQTEYQYLNKGKFLHPGGLLHSWLHGFGTVICFYGSNLSVELLMILGSIDIIIHYIIDYTKTNITKYFKWSEYVNYNFGDNYLRINSNWFFIALVLDQCLHFLTYLLLTWIMFNN